MTDVLAQVVTDTTTRAHCSGSGWWMGGMWLWWVVPTAAAVLAIVWFLRTGLQRRPSTAEG